MNALPAQVRSIAVVKLSAIGDVLHALPAIRHLARHLPALRILWVAQSELTPLLEPISWIDEVIPFDRRAGLRGIADLRRRLRAQHIDLALDLQGNWKSGIVSRLSAAPFRWGLARRDAREPGNRLFLNRCAHPVGPCHAIDRSRRVVEDLFDLPEDSAAIAWPDLLEISAQDRLEGARTLEDHGARLHQSTVVLLPGRAADPRSWPPRHHAQLAHALCSLSDVQVIILGGPEEIEEGEWIMSRARQARIIHIIGQRGLRELLGIHATLSSNPHVVVASDSGAMHLAIAGGARVLGLWGPQDPARTGPRGKGHRLLSAPCNLACRPCLARRCFHPQGPVCLTALEPTSVLEVVAQMLAEEPTGGVHSPTGEDLE